MPSLHFQATTDFLDFSKRHMKYLIWKCASYFQILYKKDTSFPILSCATAVPLTLTSLSNLGSHMVIVKHKQYLTLKTTVFPMQVSDILAPWSKRKGWKRGNKQLLYTINSIINIFKLLSKVTGDLT